MLSMTKTIMVSMIILLMFLILMMSLMMMIVMEVMWWFCVLSVAFEFSKGRCVSFIGPGMMYGCIALGCTCIILMEHCMHIGKLFKIIV